MGRFYVVGLTGKEVALGALPRISGVIDQRFHESAEAVMKHQISGSRKVWSEIYFDSPLEENSPFRQKYSDYSDILFVNDVAKDVLTNTGIELQVLEEVDEVPKSAGLLLRIPHFE